jgi:hypothetical protein
MGDMRLRPTSASAVVGMLTACVGNIGGEPLDGPSGDSADALCADTPFVRRLTVDEYIETVRAELGVDIAPEARELLPADLRTDGFTNTAGGLIVTIAHVEAYEQLATAIVERVPNLDALVAEHATCESFEETCERGFIESVGEAMYRGEIVAEELAELRTLFAAASAEGEGFREGAALVLRAMLQSPRFLYRTENERGEGARTLTSVEMASRLSYLIWGAPPDAELREAASRDELTTDEGIAAAVERMLDDPRARATSRRYLSDWLHLSRLDNVQRDPALFPDWDPALGLDMKEETWAYFEHLVWEQERPLADLFNTQVTFVSEALAAHYGLDASGEVDLSGDDVRGGLLTQGSVLTIGGNTSSMVSRGLFLLETFLCGEIDSPPPGIDTTPPVVEPGKSQRTYSEERIANAACAGCHSQFEPAAWGIERYDAVGAYSTQDPFGNDLYEDGYVRIPGDPTDLHFDTTRELMEILATSDGTMTCFSDKSLQFAMGRAFSPHDEGDACALSAVEDGFLASDRTYRELMLAIAQSPVFRTLRASEE